MIPTLKVVGKKRVFVSARAWRIGHSGHKDVKFGHAGAMMLSFEVTDVTKPPAAVHREGERGAFRSRELHSKCEKAERFRQGRTIQRAQFRKRDKDCKTIAAKKIDPTIK